MCYKLTLSVLACVFKIVMIEYLSNLAVLKSQTFAQVYLGEQFVNNDTLSDVTFLVEGIKLDSLCHCFGFHSISI